MQWQKIGQTLDNACLPDVYEMNLSGMTIVVIGYQEKEWLLSNYNPVFFSSRLLENKDAEKAKYEALMLVRDRANEISASVTVALMSEDKNES